MKKFFLSIMLLSAFVISGCNTQAADNKEIPAGNDDLKIYMLNVRHGDAILIRTKEQTILIDTGKLVHQARFVKELEKLSVTKIDKLILTHPHVDHIGNARALINPSKKELEENPYLAKISVGEVFDNGIAYTSSFYKNYMKALDTKKIHRQSLKAGDVLDFGGGVEFKVLFPTAEFVAERNQKLAERADKQNDTGENEKLDREYKMNNMSIVGRLTYKDFSMMLTGDCERDSEAKIVKINDAKDLKCDVLKAGHHGSASSSTKNFVAAVNPSVVLISSGNTAENLNKGIGSPSRKPLENYMAQGVDIKNIFCTEWNGTVTVTTDGKNFSAKPEIENEWVTDWLAKKKENFSNDKEKSLNDEGR